MKKLHSIIAMGCLVSILLVSSTSHAFASEELNPEIGALSEAGSVSSETEMPENDQAAQVMCYSDGITTEDPKSLEAYLSEDPTQPQEAIALSSETGAAIDGYQLNHDQVKILNINTGSITINADTYSQLNGDDDTPWDAKSDAYVIRGRGNSVNNITVSSPQVKITIYLMDLEWNGTITYSQNTEVELVICGEVVNHSNFLTSAKNDKLTIKGLTADGNSVSVDGFIFNNCSLNSLALENVTIEARDLDSTTSTQHLTYSLNCNNMLIDHSKVTNMAVRRSASIAEPSIVIKNNSEVKNLYSYENATNYANTIQVADSRVDNIQNYYYYYSTPYASYRFSLINVYKMIAANSVLNISASPITTLEADKCTIEIQNNLAFNNLIANLCSIKGDFVGTPVDYEAHDLFLRILRLRDHPNEYVTVSIDGGEGVRLLTDLNGCIFPYIKAGSSAITVTTADGTNFSTTFDPVTADDETVIILTPGGTGGGGTGGGEGGGTVDTEAPEITDTSLNDVYANVGDSFSLAITAKSQTKPANLTYQWYKDGVAIDTAKAKKKTYTIASAKAAQAGVYYCEVTDNNNGKVTVSKEVYVSVNAPADPKAPVITDQASNMELVAGSSVTLSVNAKPYDNRSGLIFQWYKGTTALSGETSRTLDLTKVKASDAGSYHCLITDDLLGTATESSVTVIRVK